MTQRRTALEEAVRSRGFTPSVRDVDALVDLLDAADDATGRDAERALQRLGKEALPKVLERARRSPARLRARLCRLLGKLAPGDQEAAKVLTDALDDSDPKTRRNAIIALGQFRGSKSVEDALLHAWEREDRVDHRRSLAAALGKMGSGSALDRLRAAADELTRTSGADSELVRITERAVAILDRTAKRGVGGAIDADRAPPRPVPVVLRCRAGIEALLASEAGLDLEPRVLRPGRVAAVLRGKMKSLFDCRTMLDFAFPLPQEWIRDGEDVADAVARAITSVEARMIFDTWTVGPARYRIAWGTGGHQRALVWRVAKLVGVRAPYLVNDPTGSTWEVTATPTRRFVDVEITPKALHDPRFFYRVGDVPAASHPTLAVSLVRVAGVSPDDVVWDPFVGSGTELVERALAGPFAGLLGTDVDPRALDVARGNLEAAGFGGSDRIELAPADATEHEPQGVTLIMTNPPMGRRSVRTPDIGELLDRFLDHAVRVLGSGGRLAWISPFPDRTSARATAAGMRIAYQQDVDMGGFFAQIQMFEKARRYSIRPPSF